MQVSYVHTNEYLALSEMELEIDLIVHPPGLYSISNEHRLATYSRTWAPRIAISFKFDVPTLLPSEISPRIAVCSSLTCGPSMNRVHELIVIVSDRYNFSLFGQIATSSTKGRS
jgi:hypothetical protein